MCSKNKHHKLLWNWRFGKICALYLHRSMLKFYLQVIIFLMIKNIKKNYKRVIYYMFSKRKNTNVANVVQALTINIIVFIIIKNYINNYKILVCYTFMYYKTNKCHYNVLQVITMNNYNIKI